MSFILFSYRLRALLWWKSNENRFSHSESRWKNYSTRCWQALRFVIFFSSRVASPFWESIFIVWPTLTILFRQKKTRKKSTRLTFILNSCVKSIAFKKNYSFFLFYSTFCSFKFNFSSKKRTRATTKVEFGSFFAFFFYFT